MDHEAFRARSAERWEQVAGGWGRRRGEFQAAAAPVSMWMVEAISPQPGQTVLEVAAGPGDTGFLAAEMLRPAGRLISTDGSEAMVQIAKERATELQLDDVVETRTMQAEWLDLSAASVDAILCRWGYMLLADPEAALRDARRVLRPGGVIALAVWSAPDESPLISAVDRATRTLDFVEASDPAEPGPFALSDPAALTELLSVAGFADIEIEQVDFEMTFESLDAAWEHQRDISQRLSALVSTLSPADHYALRDAFDAALAPWVDEAGEVRLPFRSHVARAYA